MAPIKDSDPKGADNLQEVLADERASLVSEVSYEFDLTMKKGSPDYNASIKIQFKFDTKKKAENIFLDFTGKEISKLDLNGSSVLDSDKIQWKAHRIYFDSSILEEHNSVYIAYCNDYDHTGAGLHQFEDPEDKQEYIYSNFEPFDCHRMIPCFDQPNIKATLKVSITGPSDWQLIANSRIEKTTKIDENTVKQDYEITPKISTYLYAVVAGPYTRYDDKYGKTDLGIYCRESLKKYMDQDELFKVSKQGLAFYEKFFHYDYPFGKYDQIFVPEFNEGAMENVGAVTFSEHYVFRETPTRSQMANRADTFLHEMAHMWFGNCVTATWWDGLWLNESFATYMAALAVAESTEYGLLSWQNFHSGMKGWAYREDQLSTTHAIQGEVVDTDATLLNFDGITYGKGASVLKQLVSSVGLEEFSSGMDYYFHTYEWGNTNLQNFLGAIEVGAKKHNKDLDLKEWSDLWLEKAGLNTLTTFLTCKDGKISDFSIEQTAPENHPTLRPHHLQVVLYDFVDNKPVLRKTLEIDVTATKISKVDTLVGEKEPSFVYINNSDYGFIKTILDEKSLKFVLENLEKFEDSLLRQLLYSTLYDMTRDAKMKSSDFIKLVAGKVIFENDLKLMSTILGRAATVLGNYIPERDYLNLCSLLFETTWKKLNESKVIEEQRILCGASLRSAQTKENVQKFLDIMDNGGANFKIEQDIRWSVVTKAIVLGIEGSQERAKVELERDSSDRGQRQFICCSSSPPDAKIKEQSWERIHKELDLSNHMMSSLMGGFSWRSQKQLLKSYESKFFDEIVSVFENQSKEYASAFFWNLSPSDPENKELNGIYEKILESLSDDLKILKHDIKTTVDDLKRAQACLALEN